MKRAPIPLEHESQVALFQWWARAWRGLGAADENLLYAVPNAAKRSFRLAAYMKAEGLRPGIPDVYLDDARGGFFGLRIEMKRQGEKPNPGQSEYHDLMRRQNYNVLVCYSTDEAIHVISAYLRQPRTLDLMKLA